MLQATGKVQVVKRQPTDVRRSNWHTGELAVMLNVKSAYSPAALGPRVIRQVVRNMKRVRSAEMVEEDLCVGGCDVRNQLELFGTLHRVECRHRKKSN